MKIVISSGHSKYVSGAISYINEVTEARKIVGRVGGLLKDLNCDVVEYHDNISKEQDENVNRIVRYHNSKSRNLDVSVHLNAYKKCDEPKGVEVYYVSESGKEIAEKVSAAIAKSSGLKNRGAKKRTNLGFLNGTDKTAILIEVCFVDSKSDVEIYKGKFDDICSAIAETLTGKTIKVAKKKESGPPEPSDNKRWRIQTGLFDDAASYDQAIERVKEKYSWLLHEQANTTELNPRYRIVTGLFTGKNVAEYYADQLKKEFGWNVYVVEG